MRALSVRSVTLRQNLAIQILLAAILTTAAPAATITWTGGSGNQYWSTAANWDLGHTPLAGDDVVIPFLPTAPVVTYNGGTYSINSLSCDGALILSSGVITIAGPFVCNGALTLGGAWLGGTGDFAISGPFTWTAGRMEGTGTTTVASATWMISGSADVWLYRRLVNLGSCTWSGSGQSVYLQVGGVFENRSGGSFRAVGTGILQNTSLQGWFENQTGASVEIAGVAGITKFQTSFINRGSIDVTAGEAWFLGRTYSPLENYGSIQAAAGTILRFTSGTMTCHAESLVQSDGDLYFTGGAIFQDGSTFLAAATVTFAGVGFTFEPAATFIPSATVVISQGTVTIPFDLSFPSLVLGSGSAAILTGDGDFTIHDFTWSGGRMTGAGTTTLPAGAIWYLTGPGPTLLTRLFVNQGVGFWRDGDFSFGTGGIIRNSATFNIECNKYMTGATGRFENTASGLVQKTGGSETSALNIPFDNLGTLTVQSGEVLFSSVSAAVTNIGRIEVMAGARGSFASGSFTSAAGSILDNAGTVTTAGIANFAANSQFVSSGPIVFAGGSATFDPAANFQPQGPVSITSCSVSIPFDLYIAQLTLGPSYDGVLAGAGNVSLGGLTWSGGRMEGAGRTTIDPGVSWSLAGTGNQILKRELVNNGDVVWSSSYSAMYLDTGAVFRNNGAFRIRCDKPFYESGTNPRFENEVGAIFEKSASIGTNILGIDIVNRGTMDIQSGGVEFVSSSISNAGTIRTAPGTSFVLNGNLVGAAGSTITNQGTMSLAGTSSYAAGASFVATGPVSFRSSQHVFQPTATFIPSAAITVNGGRLDLPFRVDFSDLTVGPMTGSIIAGAGDITATAFAWTGGQLTGTGTVTIPAGTNWVMGGTSLILDRPLANLGDGTWSGNGDLQLQRTFRNGTGSVFRIQGGRSITGPSVTGRFENQSGALLELDSAPGTISISGPKFFNQGILDVRTGIFAIAATGFQNFNGTTLAGGTYRLAGVLRFAGANIVTNSALVTLDGAAAAIQDETGGNALANFAVNAAGAGLTLVNGREVALGGPLANSGAISVGPNSRLVATNYTQSTGETILAGGTLTSAGPIAINGGRLAGDGTVVGNLAVAGTIAPGAPFGAIEIQGDYSQGSGGVLAVEILGRVPELEYDRLVVTGIASLAGTVDVDLVGSFLPDLGEAFTFLNFASRTGAFAGLTGEADGFILQQRDHDALLRFGEVPVINVLCNVDPLVVTLADGVGGGVYRDMTTVSYLGGGSAPVAGYDIEIAWDPAVGMAAFTRPSTGPFSTAAEFEVTEIGSGHVRLSAAIGGPAPGIEAGDLFDVQFTAAPVEGITTPLTLSAAAFRSALVELVTGIHAQGATVAVDVIAPAIQDLAVVNATLPDTDAYVKDTDLITVAANVSDGDPGFGADGIAADLSGLGGAATAPPQSFGPPAATWTVPAAVCAPRDGTILVSVTATDPLGNATVATRAITADNTPPTPVSGLTAHPGHEKIDLQWGGGADANFARTDFRYVRRTGYPQYDGPAPSFPAHAGDGQAACWSADTHTVWSIQPRDVYYLAAFAWDRAGNVSITDPELGNRAVATNYWLGDVAGGGENGGDGRVDTQDISSLGSTYGVRESVDPDGFNPACDVGPTSNWSSFGIPLTDDIIDFEDLVIFALNFGEVQPGRAEPSDGAPTLAWGRRSETEWVLTLLAPYGGLKGLDLRASLPTGITCQVRRGDLMTGQEAPTFLQNIPSNGLDAGLVVLGQNTAIVGAGDLVIVTFSEPLANVDVNVRARGTVNQDLAAEVESATAVEIPNAAFLGQNAPNPLNPRTTITFGLPEPSLVRLAIFDLAGARVRLLVEDQRAAGVHAVEWDGRDDTGRAVAAGAYIYRIDAGALRECRKMLVVK